MGKSAVAGAAVPLYVSSSVLAQPGNPGANDRIQIGLIGAGGRGTANLNACTQYPDVTVTGICDVWKSKRERMVERFKETAKPYVDYREMLGQKDIDAVIIATPHHWHALQAIDACEAQKDIYVEKPMTLYPAEGLALKRAVEKHHRISQIGTQIHAGENYRRVVELVRSGNLGRVSVVRTFVAYNQGTEGLGPVPDSEPPAELDWERWIGPARMRPYKETLGTTSAYWGQFMDYSGGITPGMAPHIIDLPYWALELDFPITTSCSGGRYVSRGIGDAPDAHEVLWQYPGFTMTWMASLVNSYGFDFQGKPGIRRRLGIYFHGVNGTLFSDYHTHEIVPEGDRMKETQPPERSIPPSPGHQREWLDSIKSRKQPSCSVFYHYKLDVACTLANLSLKLGRSIRFDPAMEKIVGDQEAAALSVPEYRDPWKFPRQYL
jgi:predicted dehydrogenase